MSNSEISKSPKEVSQKTNLQGRPTTPSRSQMTPYTNPAGDQYPVIVYNNYDLDQFKEESKKNIGLARMSEVLTSVQECGFNVNLWRNGVGKGIGPDIIAESLAFASDLELRTILFIQSMGPYISYKNGTSSESDTDEDKPYFALDYGLDTKLDALKSVLKRYTADNPEYSKYSEFFNNLWGYYITDEPGYFQWAYPYCCFSDYKSDLSLAWRSYFYNQNGRMAFFNLVAKVDEGTVGPEIASMKDSNGNKASTKAKYKAYLKEIRDRFIPSLMSVDIYPVVDRDHTEGKPTDPSKSHKLDIKSDYYSYMEAIAEFSSEQGIPFWIFMLSNQHTTYNVKNQLIGCEYPFPTPGILRFQAMTALAFGIKGLVFWNYVLYPKKRVSEDKITVGEEYFNAPYNGATNEKTEIWYNCKEVIPEIKFYGKKLLNAKFIKAQHIAGINTAIFLDITMFSGNFGCISKASANGNGLLMSHLADADGSNYIAMVSRDPKDNQIITYTIPKTFKWEKIKQTTTLPGSEDFVDTATETTTDMTTKHVMRPGEMVLIRYQKQFYISGH